MSRIKIATRMILVVLFVTSLACREDNRSKAQSIIQIIEAGDSGQLRGHLEAGLDANLRIKWTRRTLGNQSEFPDFVSLLWLAASKNRLSMCMALVEHGAIVDAKSEAKGDTPLSIAAQLGHSDIVKFLLREGANPNARNNRGMTPLHCVSISLDKTTIQYLIDAGADVNAEDHLGWTPVFYVVASSVLNRSGELGSESSTTIGALKVMAAHSANLNHFAFEKRVSFLRMCFQFSEDEVIMWAVENGAKLSQGGDLDEIQEYAKFVGKAALAERIHRFRQESVPRSSPSKSATLI